MRKKTSILNKVIISIFILFAFAVSSRINAASNFINYAGNPITDYLSLKPSVLFNQGIYKMWFNTDVGIEYATSTDSINWTKHSQNPVLLGSLQDLFEAGVQEPSVLFDNNIYHMWYTTIPQQGPYTLKYATSTDGVNWTKVGVINLPVQQFEGGSRIEPNVIKVGSEYWMWYTGNDGTWKISLATSNDGINWIPYANNPVLYPTEWWEGGSTAGASVLYDGTTFEMYYHGSTGISYATSLNGINWTKPADKNPVIGPSGGWDTNQISPSALKLSNGTTLLYYSSFGFGTWRVGLATDGPIASPSPSPTPTVTPSPIPTQTPTPIPTNTPTPSPTPTPLAVTKVIVIPGFGASWNADALIGCTVGSSNSEWELSEIANSIYSPMVDALKNAGLTPLVFTYDWRKDIRETASTLKTFITNNTVEGERVHMIGHSMGGLVARAYVENTKTASRVEKMITVGSPHQGAPAAYAAWSAGQVWNDDIQFRIFLTLLIKNCKLKNGVASDKQAVHRFVPSVQNMLPIFEYLIDKKTKMPVPVQTMTNRNNWLPTTGFVSPFYNISLMTVAGSKIQTLNSMDVIPRHPLDRLFGIWSDGKPTKKHFTLEGDGTVLLKSAHIHDALNNTIEHDHTRIISSTEGIQTVVTFLGASPQRVKSQISDAITSALVVFDESGSVSTVPNPEERIYEFSVTKSTIPKRLVVVQFTPSGETYWNEYTVKRTEKIKIRYRSDRAIDQPIGI